MIKIKIEKNNEDMSLRITANGHANTAQRGRDTVCAAVSALIYSFADEIAHIPAEKFKRRTVRVGSEKGQAYIEAKCTSERAYTRVIYNLAPVQRGLETLAQRYPEAVNIIIDHKPEKGV